MARYPEPTCALPCCQLISNGVVNGVKVSGTSNSKNRRVGKDVAHEELCIQSIRAFCLDIVRQHGFGHPGMPLGMAPSAFALWSYFYKFSNNNPTWYNRDRFILSNGHGSALLYTMLYLTGYLNIDDIKGFIHLNTKCPGHPEADKTPGVDATTGPLGQGFAVGVGMAIAQRHVASIYSKPEFEDLFEHTVYVFAGDGCLQEGVCCEAASLAGHLGLGNLIVVYDDNEMTQDGSTDLAFTEDVIKRFESYDWNTIEILNGDTDVEAIESAIERSKRSEKPTLNQN
eukprot:TRINITY_DN2866_c0_g1_i1.p1 TRINITY_DN2866_c0_g1~~TRINITY_DN2866_c0_g1_i1.p1  ORF type:complete len:285 (-),score=44.80 TRINITY_DN2866_c0_g1_i1:172-1026(-)